MNRISKKLTVLILLISLLYLMNGCFPDRSPVAPEQNDTRRPKVAYSLPGDESIITSDTREATVWFDELMNQNTVSENFSISITPDVLPWTNVQSVASIAISGSEPNFLFLGYGVKGILYSDNGGSSWKFIENLTDKRIRITAIDPTDSRIIFAATDSALFRSQDKGIDWSEAGNGLPSGIAIHTISFDGLNSRTVWLGTSHGIYKSSDGGESWQSTGTPPSWSGQEYKKIAVDPGNSSIVYAATLGRYIYKSIDGGTAWTLIRGTSKTLPTSRIYDIEIDPANGMVLYAATINRGIYKSTDAGENWSEANNGIDDLNTRQVRVDPSNSLRVYALTPGQIFVSKDSAGTWEKVDIPAAGEENLDLLISPSDGQNLLAATNKGIYRSLDQGVTWNVADEIDQQSLLVRGSFSFEEWQGEMQFVTVEGDTVTAQPYQYGDTGLDVPTPFEQNPKATKMIFTLQKSLIPHWNYYLLVGGAFTGDSWRHQAGAQDIHGMSLEYDYTSLFTVQ
ncbi:MAG: hypothetical protein P8184_03585 [Calditrichia bacterium]